MLQEVWKYKYHILVSGIILFGIVFLLNLMIVTESIFKVAQDNDWIGFWGGVLSAVLSGIITFIVLKVTIDNEDKKRKGDKEEIEDQRLEDKRMSILPYLHYYIDNNINPNKELNFASIITPKDFSDNKLKYTHPDGVFKEDRICRINLIVENVGLGLAIDPYVVNMKYDGITIIKPSCKRHSVLNIGEKLAIITSVSLDDDISKPLDITIGYFNLLRDYYEQEVTIYFKSEIIIEQGKNKEILRQYIKASGCDIEKVSKAYIKEEPNLNNFL